VFIKIVVALVAFWLVGACGVANAMISERMLTEVNAQLAETERFSRTWWDPMKNWRFYREYWRLGLPKRPLVWQGALGIAMLAAVLALSSILTNM
jgi:hypothetical protein